MLRSAASQYVEQQQLAALGLSQARRAGARGAVQAAKVINRYQATSALLALEFVPLVLSEQGISDRAVGRPVVDAMVTGSSTVGLLDQAQTDTAFDRLVLSLISDAGRTATSVDMATRPAVTGYVRSLVAPSCSRCAILAGRVYRYSTGFQRHPRCDCLMTPTNDTAGRELVTDPTDLFNRGQITGLSRADADAINAGADMGQVVNVRSKAAGLTNGSSVFTRAGRPTPAGIYGMTTSKAEALTLLRRFGYVL
jgi:hypothetical protein